MKSILIFNFCLLSLFVFASPKVQAQDSPLQTTQAHSTARFISEHKFFFAGQTYYLGLHIQLEPEWHTYWINPGDSAAASIFKFNKIPGVTFEKAHYPVPSRFQVGPFYSFGYEKEVLIQFPIKIAKDSPTRSLDIQLQAEWLVCKKECIPASYTFKMKIPSPPPMRTDLTEGEVERLNQVNLNSKYASLFKEGRKQWPRTETFKSKLNFKRNSNGNEALEIILDPKVNVVDIFSYPKMPLGHQPPKKIKKPQDQKQYYSLQYQANSEAKENYYKVLVTYKNDQNQLRSLIVETPQANKLQTTFASLGLMLLFAFLGGLILNLMPCVFPVLMLKVFQTLSSHQKERSLKSALLYTLGVLVSFWLLALIILLAKISGHALGWGFQLQSPAFLIFLIFLFFAMALYFLDALRFPGLKSFSLGTNLSRRNDALGSFFTGVLAVIVASPCTAPFMGAAMGYALTRSLIEILGIFTALGLGLSFPFLLLAIFPKSLAWLPRPGVWMLYFKKLMALPLFATALWLTWVLLQILSPGYFAKTQPNKNSYWQVYSEENLEHLKQDSPVFVNFTAAWCISCQVNERLVFQTEKVQSFLKENKIKVLKADWTRKDSKLAATLKSYGRAGVPLYLFFVPGQQEPLILPEVLSPQTFIDKIQETLKNSTKD